MNQTKVGKLIAHLRKERGWTQEEFGEKLGVTNKTVSRWETGRYMPDIDKLQELAILLGVGVEELLDGELSMQAEKPAPATPSPAESPFDRQEKILYFRRKWLLEHRGAIAGWVLIWLILLVAAVCTQEALLCAAVPIYVIYAYARLRNRMMIYIEEHVY